MDDHTKPLERQANDKNIKYLLSFSISIFVITSLPILYLISILALLEFGNKIKKNILIINTILIILFNYLI